ncbi:hypothetical protein ACNOYE_08480 [Nannocystaceae bacterium ST9]
MANELVISNEPEVDLQAHFDLDQLRFRHSSGELVDDVCFELDVGERIELRLHDPSPGVRLTAVSTQVSEWARPSAAQYIRAVVVAPLLDAVAVEIIASDTSTSQGPKTRTMHIKTKPKRTLPDDPEG